VTFSAIELNLILFDARSIFVVVAVFVFEIGGFISVLAMNLVTGLFINSLTLNFYCGLTTYGFVLCLPAALSLMAYGTLIGIEYPLDTGLTLDGGL
jgi:hypothetical protein